LLNRFADRGKVDLIEEFAARLPITTIMELSVRCAGPRTVRSGCPTASWCRWRGCCWWRPVRPRSIGNGMLDLLRSPISSRS
jgi:hypothetical protein